MGFFCCCSQTLRKLSDAGELIVFIFSCDTGHFLALPMEFIIQQFKDGKTNIALQLMTKLEKLREAFVWLTYYELMTG